MPRVFVSSVTEVCVTVVNVVVVMVVVCSTDVGFEPLDHGISSARSSEFFIFYFLFFIRGRYSFIHLLRHGIVSGTSPHEQDSNHRRQQPREILQLHHRGGGICLERAKKGVFKLGG